MEESVNVKVFRIKEVQKLFDAVAPYYEGKDELQVTVDLLALAVLQAEIFGLETSSIVGLVAQQQPMARKIADKLLGDA